MTTWKATIRFIYGDVPVTVQAIDQHTARAMLEAMYGKGKILSGIVSQY